MKELNENNGVYINDEDYFTKEDLLNLIRLQKIVLEKRNILLSIEECGNVWQRHSWDLSASWLFFPEKDDDILIHIEKGGRFTNYEDYSKI